MRLRAIIKEHTGSTQHAVGRIEDGESVKVHDLPVAKSVEIAEQSDGVYLYHYDAAGECIADTWHLSIDEAKAQAEFEFKIGKADWEEVRDQDKKGG